MQALDPSYAHDRSALGRAQAAAGIVAQALHLVDEPLDVPSEGCKQQRRWGDSESHALGRVVTELAGWPIHLEVARLPQTEVKRVVWHILGPAYQPSGNAVVDFADELAALRGRIEQAHVVRLAVE